MSEGAETQLAWRDFADFVAQRLVAPAMESGEIGLSGWQRQEEIAVAEYGLAGEAEAWCDVPTGAMLVRVAGTEAIFALGPGIVGRPDPVLTDDDAEHFLPAGLNLVHLSRDDGEVRLRAARDEDDSRGAVLVLRKEMAGWTCKLIRARFRMAGDGGEAAP